MAYIKIYFVYSSPTYVMYLGISVLLNTAATNCHQYQQVRRYLTALLSILVFCAAITGSGCTDRELKI